MFILVLFLLGLAIGPISSFFGVGGGFLIVAVLYWLYPDLSAQVVVSTSLGVICLNSIINVRNFRKLHMVPEWRLALSIALTMAFGCLFGSRISPWFSVASLRLVVACLLFINSVTTFFRKEPEGLSNGDRGKAFVVPLAFCLIFMAGVLAGITGLGGGIVVIPVFFYLLRIPFRRLSLYSNIAMVGSSSMGVVNYALMGYGGPVVFEEEFLNGFQFGRFNIFIVLCIFTGACISSPLGVGLRKRVGEGRDRYLLSALLFVLSCRLFWSLLG